MNWVTKEKMNMPMPVFVFLCLASHEALSFIFLMELFCDYANMNLVKLWSWPKSNVRLVNEPNKNTRQKCKTDPLTFTFFHFSPLTFSFVNLVL